MVFRVAALWVCLLAVTAAACGDGGSVANAPTGTPVAATVAPSATPVPTLAEVGAGGATPAPGVAMAVVADLARRLSVVPGAVSVVSIEARTWPNSCLGLNAPGQACAANLVPGWLAVLRGPDGREYRYRGAGERFQIEP